MPDQASQTSTGVLTAPNRRNLVLTVDGTSNKFGSYNTNVIELYSRLEASDEQLNYYNSGIGTITKQKSTWKSITRNFDSAIDLAIAWNFENVIIAAYRWLSEHYKPGDRIFLFGFSRGAYQMRVLAAMVTKVGLIQEGNVEQIPFAFELYKTEHNESIARQFKDTFSRKGVSIHFLGVWDTVSSVGLVGNKTLPMTDGWEHIGIFRHALALDERRVKFIPECVMRKRHLDKDKKPVNFDEQDADVVTASGEKISVRRLKEVWFAGSHSDVGGGNLPNDGLNLESAPLLWMVHEAALAGLLLTQSTVEWKVQDLETAKPHQSLRNFWWALEVLPIHRQSRSSRSETSYSHVHHAKSRVIYPGQKIHASVAFKNTRYHTEAAFYPTPGALKKLANSQKKAQDAPSLQKAILQSFLVQLDEIAASIVSKSLAIYRGAEAKHAWLEAKAEAAGAKAEATEVEAEAARVEAEAARVEAKVARPKWSQLVAEGPGGNFHKDWKPRLEMDLFDLEPPSRAFQLLLGGLSDSNTLHVLNRLGVLASLDGGADAILSKVKQRENSDDKDDGKDNDKKDTDKSRRLTLKRLLDRKELIFLATVTLLARLAKKASQQADRFEMETFLSHSYSVASPSRFAYLVLAIEAPLAGKVVEGAPPTHHWYSTDKGIAGRIDHCLALEESIRGEAVQTITEIAPIGDLLTQLHSLGVTEKLVRMLSAKDATVTRSPANAPAALATSPVNTLRALATSSVNVALAPPSVNVALATPSANVALATSPVTALRALATSSANVALTTPSANVALATPSADVPLETSSADALAALATSSANALVALARYGEADLGWQTIFGLLREKKPNFNSRLRAPGKRSNDVDTRDAAAIIVADLADHLVKSQTPEKPFAPSGMTRDQVGNIINKDTITLLNAMLVNKKSSHDSAADAQAKQKRSDSAANALAKISCHAEFRNLIIDNAAPNLVTMLSKHSGSAAKALAALMLDGSNKTDDVQRLILGHGPKTSKIGVTSKTKTLLLAIVDMLKDRSRRSAAIILTGLILYSAAAARIIVESNAPETLLQSLNKRDVTTVRTEDYAEYGSLVQCLAAIVNTYTRLRKNLKAEDAYHPPLKLTFELRDNGARLLFGLMGNPPERQAAVDAWVALTEDNHTNVTLAHGSENIPNIVLDEQCDGIKADLGAKLEQINNKDKPPENLSALASDIASMIMALAVLGHANAKQLVVVFRLLHSLWFEAFETRTSSPSNRQDALRDDAYGEQADLAADAIAQAISHPDQIVRKQFSEHCEADSKDEADPNNLVALLAQRLGAQSQDGTWDAIKQLANSAREDDKYKDDDCREAVCSNPNLLPTLVWLSRDGNKRQNIFASKCLAELAELNIGSRHEHVNGKMGKIRKVSRTLLGYTISEERKGEPAAGDQGEPVTGDQHN